MDSSQESKLNRKVLLVSLVCLMGAGLGSYFLYQDIHSLGNSRAGKSVGRVQRVESQVRRKASSTYVWNNVESNTSLYKKDSVQTGRESAVSIQLNDGSVIDMAENSLVVMDDVDTISLNFLRGTIVVHQADGDRKISVDKNGKQKIEVLAVRLNKPESLAKYYVANKDVKPISFLWEVRNKKNVDSLSIQISQDRRFPDETTKTVQLESIKELQREYKTQLDPGSYFWRIVAKTGPVTETRAFKILTVEPIAPIWPEDNEVVSAVANSKNEIEMQFRWKNANAEGLDAGRNEQRAEADVEVVLEVAKDSAFKNLVTSYRVDPDAGHALFSQVAEGIYYWRMRSKYADLVMQTLSRKFEIKRISLAQAPVASVPAIEKIAPLDAPVSAQPNANTEFNLLEDHEPRKLSWSEVPKAKGYEVTVYMEGVEGGGGGAEVGAGSAARKLVVSKKVEKTELFVDELKEGNYLWSVRALDQQKLPGTSLPFRKLIINYGKTLDAPQILSPEVQ